jgi:hypothetical protein
VRRSGADSSPWASAQSDAKFMRCRHFGRVVGINHRIITSLNTSVIGLTMLRPCLVATAQRLVGMLSRLCHSCTVGSYDLLTRRQRLPLTLCRKDCGTPLRCRAALRVAQSLCIQTLSQLRNEAQRLPNVPHHLSRSVDVRNDSFDCSFIRLKPAGLRLQGRYRR